MPRYNVQNPDTKEWRCFSSIVDDYVTDWMPEDEYEEWRKRQYRGDWCPVRAANQMTMAEAEEIIRMMNEPEEEE